MSNQYRRDRSFSRMAGAVGLGPREAQQLLDALHAAGLAIHDVENCRRIPWQERGKVQPIETMGREMTEAEMLATGVLLTADVPDDA